MEPASVERWNLVARRISNHRPAGRAQANEVALQIARERWGDQLIPRTSMYDLLFTLPGDQYPFDETLRVSWDDGVFTFCLVASGVVVTADRCQEANIGAVLPAFLGQLARSWP